jgi:hypothetical protein
MAKKKAKARKKAVKKVAKKTAKRPVKKAAPKAKKAARKPAARRPGAPKSPARSPSSPQTPKTGVTALPAEKQVEGGVLLGHVDDYFGRVGVMALKLLASVSVGDMIRVKGHTSDITQQVESMQIEHQPVQTASAGDAVGIKIAGRVRRTDLVYKI